MDCVVDDYPKGAHEEQDEGIRLLFPPLTPQNFDLLSPLILAFIVKLSGGRLHSNYLNVSECEIIIKEEPRLRSMLLDGSNHGYKPVRLLKLLQPPSPVSSMTSVSSAHHAVHSSSAKHNPHSESWCTWASGI